MCSLCNGKKVIRQESGSMVAFHACPNCKIEKQDLIDTISQLNAIIQKWQQEKSA
ncbi:hypothetical protein NST30_12990 [Bacillus sp. FSL K6-3846]|uniref:hypothetical protein n=1 Tax=Bacillus TaxID=1386 RepID=UPI00137F4A94|nr:hypothetical protein [Bacillus licheniformis]MCM3212753.1 hypothetical protein [Bacillus licheniformis]MCM3288358.1 hypothetical protein [Bacillus licheniformis]MDE1420731.1 hypothetical protein [Bacillus licheniformis]MED4326725.1 hypothetical protein [Bacillus licheniformis]MED4382770.1 hypothetical protein [Bacillus licheniformis]